MQKQTYKIKGMHCASCSVMIEKELKKVPGVNTVEANYGTESVKLDFDITQTNPQELSSKLEHLGYSLVIPAVKPPVSVQSAREMGMSENEHSEHLGLNQSKQEKLAELATMRTQIYVALPLALISVVIMAWDILAKFALVPAQAPWLMEFFHHLLPLLATYMLFVVGKPYLMGFYRFLRYGKANMDTLIGIGTSVAYVYSFVVSAFADTVLATYINVTETYYDVTIVVIAFIALGKYLEARSKLRTGDAIEKLLNLSAKTALVIRPGATLGVNEEVEISVDQVVHGDLIIIKPGAKVPVDGEVTAGESYVDEAMVTGEPMPVGKHVGDSVVAGTINTTGSFTFRATKVGSETLLANIVRMVEEAQGSRAPIQALADKISGIFVPIVLVIAFVTLVFWLLIGTSNYGFATALSYGLTTFVGVLVIACPCALGLATPTAIIVGVGKGAREGILIKDSATLEKLHKVDVVVIDKTGTITRGKPEVVSISDQETFGILATLESKSEHPIAHAVLEYAKSKSISLLTLTNFESIKGKGVKGVIDGVEYYAGNTKLVADLGIKFDPSEIETQTKSGKTPIILATKERVVSVVFVADAIKPEAVQAINDLHALGVKVVMLTGDNKHTARAIADEVGIDEVVAEVMPEDKLRVIEELQSGEFANFKLPLAHSNRRLVVAMAGDGVNDAPALARADVGIAMGTGTDVAIETAGITLLGGDISKLVKAIKLSKLTMRGIKQNLFFAFAYNTIGIPLAAGLFFPFFGWLLSPVFAGLAMALSSVSVVGNSLRLKSIKL